VEQFDYEPWPGPDHVPAPVALRHLLDGVRGSFTSASRGYGKSMHGLTVAAMSVDETSSQFVAIGTRIGNAMHVQIREAVKVAEVISKAFDIPKPDPTKKVHGPLGVQPFSQRGPKRISAPDNARGCGIVSDRIGWRHGRR
jgi:hypothetical protein